MQIKIARPYHDAETETAVLAVLRSGHLVSGPTVALFEEEMARYINVRNVVAVNSGTAALHLSLLASDIRQGQEVITTPFSFAATANTIVQAGAKPVFVDVNPETYNIDVAQIPGAMTKKTAAIEPVHVFGEPAEMRPIREIAEKQGLRVIEDAAEAIGAEYYNTKIGNTKEFACFSTYATKNLHTGEGGFITTNDDQAAKVLRILRSQGQESKYHHVKLGYNYRMTEIAAAIGTVQIKKIDDITQKRIENAINLSSKIKGIPAIAPQASISHVRHVYYQYTVRFDERMAGMTRKELQKKLTEKGIETDVHWPAPIHLQPWYRETFGYRPGAFPNSEKLAETVLSLPIHPSVTPREIEYIASTLHEILDR